MFVKIGAKEIKDLSKAELETLSTSAEHAERYEDMCQFMKALISKVCSTPKGPEANHRNMLSVAFKNVVGAKRQAMRNLKNAPQESEIDVDVDLALKYQKLVESEVIDVCNEVLQVVVDNPLKTALKADAEADDAAKDANKDDGVDDSKVFWLKMCGDYCRYLAEITDNDDATVNIKQDSINAGDKKAPEKGVPKEWAEFFYDLAMDNARKTLPETHPTRLGLALNFSVCHYEILDKKDDACKLAKQAFDAAIEKLDTLNDKSYKDSTLIMQLLRDNLTLWTSDNNDEQ